MEECEGEKGGEKVMGFEIEVIDNSPEFIAAVKQGIKKAMAEIADQAESNVADLAPVDTTRLKTSITGVSDDDTAYIGTNVEYAPYVEMGHTQTPGRYVPALGKRLVRDWVAPRPFLKPGIMNNMDEYEEIAKQAIESCLP